MPDQAAAAIFVTGDLIFASKVQAAASRTGNRLEIVMSPAAALERAAGLRLVLIDLTTPGLGIDELVSKLQALDQPPAIIAYAPHVHEQTLAAAKAAGCDEVLTRGQFNSQIDSLLGKYLAEPK